MTERAAASQSRLALSLGGATRGLIQRQCACGMHTTSGDTCVECSKSEPGLQRKLAIGSSEDPLEREADRVADQVMSMTPGRGPGGAPLRVQRFTGPSVAATAESGDAPAVVEQVLASPGRPLVPALRNDMEQRFGTDFSRVRIHTGAEAESSARSLAASAYAFGSHIVFGAGQFAPATHAGQRLLAHELAHVIQQRGAMAAPIVQRAPPDIVKSIQQLTVDLADPKWRQTLEFKGGQTQVVYVLRDATTGEYLKVGKTTVQAIPNRFAEYVTAGNKWSRRLAAEVWTFRGRSSTNVELFEAQIRAGMEKMGETLPWDNTNARLGRPGQGIPMPKEQTETQFIDEVEQLRVKHAPPNIPPRRGTSSTQKAKLKDAATGKSGGETGTKADQGAGKAAPDASADPAVKGGAPAAEPTQVGTEIKVLKSARNADGSMVAEVEYNFGENLSKINESLPEGSKLPARIAVRISQNADGAITTVEALSGQPKALVEALARQTLSGGASNAAGGAGDGAALAEGSTAGEGVAVAGRGVARLATGLKIGGWVTFAVITGYELYTATPEGRPKVLVKAGGGLAGAAVGSYLICNAALGLETVGWSLLICAFVAGGAGGYAGSQIAGEVYGDVPGTPLHEALAELDRKPRNLRVLFNLVMENRDPAFLPPNDTFVRHFMSVVPDDLKDYEVVILAGQMATLRHIDIAPDYSGLQPGGPGSICPNCHQTYRQQKEQQQKSIQELYERRRQQAAIEEHRQNRESRLQMLKTAIANLPERTHATPLKAHPGGPLAFAPHLTGPNVSAPANAIPPTSRQQGTVCPNCHLGNGDSRSLIDRFGGFGKGPGGQMTDADMQRLKEFVDAQPH